LRFFHTSYKGFPDLLLQTARWRLHVAAVGLNPLDFWRFEVRPVQIAFEPAGQNVTLRYLPCGKAEEL
jgi:hypothetical protein